MAFQTIQWGNVTLLMDHPAFQEGYLNGRQYYFEGEQEAEKHHNRSSSLPASCLLRVIAMPDEQGRYQLDDGCDITTLPHGVEDLLGVLVGYLSGPLHPETEEEQHARVAEYVIIPEQMTVRL